MESTGAATITMDKYLC